MKNKIIQHIERLGVTTYYNENTHSLNRGGQMVFLDFGKIKTLKKTCLTPKLEEGSLPQMSTTMRNSNTFRGQLNVAEAMCLGNFYLLTIKET